MRASLFTAEWSHQLSFDKDKLTALSGLGWEFTKITMIKLLTHVINLRKVIVSDAKNMQVHKFVHVFKDSDLIVVKRQILQLG